MRFSLFLSLCFLLLTITAALVLSTVTAVNNRPVIGILTRFVFHLSSPVSDFVCESYLHVGI